MDNYRLGAVPLEGKVYFKVWAPNADSVDVLLKTGQVSWDSNSQYTRNPLVRNAEDGYWLGEVSGFGAGDLYRFELTNGERTFQRLDPVSRDTVESWSALDEETNLNASIIVSLETYHFDPYEPPNFDDYIIYQLHIGSFAGRGDGLNKNVSSFRDIENKLDYIADLGFNAIELLPIQEFMSDRSWGYNPALFFAPETAYGSPSDLKRFVNVAHSKGLAVFFDVVYNHAGPQDNSIWEFDGSSDGGGIYFEGGQNTPWGAGPAWWKEEVKQFFFENVRMYFEEYSADGLRFDATTQMNGNELSEVIRRLKIMFPNKYFIAEHLPNHPWIVKQGNFDATWTESHHEFQRAMQGSMPVERVKNIAGWLGYNNHWNLVKSLLGSHDDIGDDRGGNAEDGISISDRAHRYFVDHFGGRDNWYSRAKCRLAWALNIGIAGTPMLFMGSECMMSAPNVAWGYWHDGVDIRGDHRFDWSFLDNIFSVQMRRLVQDCNNIRQNHEALKSSGLEVTHEDYFNSVICIKRWNEDTGQVVLVVANMGDVSFVNKEYGVNTGSQFGSWSQILCTQDEWYGGWDFSGNAFYHPVTQEDGHIYINLPKWSVVMMALES